MTTNVKNKKGQKNATINTVKESVNKEETKVLNFSFLSQDFKDFDNVEKTKKGASEIYKFKDSITDIERKSERRKLKRQRINLCNDILLNANKLQKKQNEENLSILKDSINNFDSFYTKHYILNDYSISSILAKNSKDKNVERVLEIIKEIKSI